MQHAHHRDPWLWGRRLRLVASTSGSILVTALWAAPVLAQPEPTQQPQPEAQPGVETETRTETETTYEREVTAPPPTQQPQQQQPAYTAPRPTYDTPPPPESDIAPPMGPGEHSGRYDEPERFDSGFNVYVSPGGINHPYAGRDSVNYGDTYDPGFQWGLGFGYFARSNSPFAVQIGAYFEQAMLNAEDRGFWDDEGENILRAGLELEPGFVVGERLFLSIPLRGGWAGYVVEREGENGDRRIDDEHGPMFGVGLGMDLAIWRGFYIGTAVGTDLQFFRSNDDFDMYTFAWRTRIGYRF